MPPLAIFLLTLLLLPTLFLGITSSFPVYFTPSKRRSGILSFFVSSTMTLLSIPFVMEFVQAGGDVREMNERREREHEEGRKALGEVVCMVFGGYLVCDLAVGWRYYRPNLTFINGLIHHSTYLLIVTSAVLTHQSAIFALAAFLELPTFFLALANVFPEQRNDWLFATSFLATRIGFHAWIVKGFVGWAIRGGDGTREAGVLVGSRRVEEWAGVFFLCLAFPLHVHWFKNNALGMLRRSRLAAAASPPTTISSSASQPHPLTLSKTYSSTTSLTNYSPTSSRSSLSLEIDLEQEEKDHAVDSNGNASGGGLGGLEVLMKL